MSGFRVNLRNLSYTNRSFGGPVAVNYRMPYLYKVPYIDTSLINIKSAESND